MSWNTSSPTCRRVIVAADVLLPVVDKVRAKTALQQVFVVRYAELFGAPSIDVPAELLAMPAAMAPVLCGLRRPPGRHPHRRAACARGAVDGRRLADDLHLGHHRPAQGRDAELWQRHLQDRRVGRLQRFDAPRKHRWPWPRCTTSPAW